MKAKGKENQDYHPILLALIFTIFFFLVGCSSVPSYHVIPNQKNMYFGMTFSLEKHKYGLYPLAKLDFGYRINSLFQTGLSYTPTLWYPLPMYWEVYVLSKFENLSNSNVSIYPYLSLPFSISSNWPNYAMGQKGLPIPLPRIGTSLTTGDEDSGRFLIDLSFSPYFTSIKADPEITSVTPQLPLQLTVGLSKQFGSFSSSFGLTNIGLFDYIELDGSAGFTW